MERNNTHSVNRDGLLLRSESRSAAVTTTSSDFVLQWGNRKRLRCMKSQAKDHHINKINNSSGSGPVQRANTSTRIDRRVIRSDLNHTKDPNSKNNDAGKSNGYLNLRQRPASPSRRILRNSESSIGMRGQQSNGVRGFTSPDRGEKKSGASIIINNINNNSSHHHHTNKNTTNNNSIYNNDTNHHHGGGGGGSGSTETGQDGKKGGSSSGGDTIAAVWPPKFVIALTNKEKEEDFMAIKGSKLPQRPKKRAKFIQRTLNLVSPGAWLCDLTLERYEVREKKVSKKRPRGLKAMGNMESDSE
ncbi:hypothetical protein ABFS82_01G015500 [Erythranthe guttata]|uniref:DUF1639 domain-containing protein n=1 Tax=Erythranthe guttata TaxID=4155 RepID=A0A022Q1F7_ERYGU|nr:PREDICTED: transcription factor mef2A-like isoform X1 [Erythranthe guttata]EYU20380.1 hypothetical protein MIMGU_mgv1a010783mg [Erythranthe guttata]|eukprot:XP_012857857.1 PREDICTED: transcription factor mef2A-like isoform X1 [Erythranthe guttata]